MAQSPVQAKAAKPFDGVAESLKAIQAKGQQRSLSTPPTMIELTPATVAKGDCPEANSLEQPNPARQEHLMSEVAALRQRAEVSLQQFRAVQRRVSPTTSSTAIHPSPQAGNAAHLGEAMRRLEMLAHRSNQLSSLQETTLRELKTIADQLERNWQTAQAETRSVATDPIALCDYESVIVPHIEKNDRGAFVVRTRSIDLLQAEREAAQVAQTLRDRQDSSANANARSLTWNLGSQNWTRWSRAFLKIVMLVKRRFSQPANRRSLRKSPQTARLAQPDSLSLGDVVIWVAGAVLVRIGINALLAAYPGLWFPILGLIIAPAAIAVYRATVAPQSGYLWGCRLFLIMVGLLIGGRV